MADETVLEDIVAEVKLIDIWPNYPCLYDVRLRDCKNQNKREKAIMEMSQKLEKSVLTTLGQIVLRNSGDFGLTYFTCRVYSAWHLEKTKFPYVSVEC